MSLPKQKAKLPRHSRGARGETVAPFYGGYQVIRKIKIGSTQKGGMQKRAPNEGIVISFGDVQVEVLLDTLGSSTLFVGLRF